MAEQVKVFRRFNSWPEAEVYGRTLHRKVPLNIIYSEHRPDKDFEPIEGQCYGPWIVEDCWESTMIRGWETLVAAFPIKGKARIKVAAITRLTERQKHG